MNEQILQIGFLLKRREGFILFQAFFIGIIVIRIINTFGQWRIFKTEKNNANEFLYYWLYLSSISIFFIAESIHFIYLWQHPTILYQLTQDPAINYFKFDTDIIKL